MKSGLRFIHSYFIKANRPGNQELQPAETSGGSREENPEIAEQREREERVRAATLAGLFASREVQNEIEQATAPAE